MGSDAKIQLETVSKIFQSFKEVNKENYPSLLVGKIDATAHDFWDGIRMEYEVANKTNAGKGKSGMTFCVTNDYDNSKWFDKLTYFNYQNNKIDNLFRYLKLNELNTKHCIMHNGTVSLRVFNRNIDHDKDDNKSRNDEMSGSDSDANGTAGYDFFVNVGTDMGHPIIQQQIKTMREKLNRAATKRLTANSNSYDGNCISHNHVWLIMFGVLIFAFCVFYYYVNWVLDIDNYGNEEKQELFEVSHLNMNGSNESTGSHLSCNDSFITDFM